ncbi:MAG: 1-acyl-sn-glycerol-3-phosphate acyltransferase, partial [Bacteroidaceae bacterium]|nr:1-acyl-sn-glycerol-3-phosphate acyltransferase [Bacteroidaceae bacterium]
MKQHIQDKDWFYTFLRYFVDWSVRSSFRKYQVEGLENLPEEGSIVIWASNHTNALMDPMVMLPANKIRKVFVARADIFKKNWAKKALYFLRVMPIYRIRDGINAVKQNDEAINQATGVILDGVPFIIFPEATHRAKHSLLKLSKGIFHIAENAIAKSNGKPVYIQPIGIEYSDYFRFRNKVLVRFGQPINVNKFLEEHSDEPAPVAMLQMRGILTDTLAKEIVYIPDDEDYDAIWEYAKLKADNPEYFGKALADIESKDGKKLKGLLRIQAVDKYAVAEALEMREKDPEKARNLFAKVESQRLWRIQNGISVYSIAREPGAFKLLLKTLVALLGAPYYF